MAKNNFAKKLLRFISGMSFSIILLLVIIAACVAGSIITQGQSSSFYLDQYGAEAARWILRLQCDHVFTSVWFIVLAGLLCVNLILCSISRFSAVRRKAKEGFGIEKRLNLNDQSFELDAEGLCLADFGVKGAKAENGFEYVCRHKAGIWGSWISHLGMLLLVVSFALGQVFATEYVLYGIPGSMQTVEGTGLSVTIDSFDVELRDDFTVEQYTAGLTISSGAESISGTASVNHPMSAFGYSIYQDSTGWANYVDIYDNDTLITEGLICAGEYISPDGFPDLVLYFNKFYPDLASSSEGMTSATPLLNNPYSLYTLYYKGNVIAMDMAAMGDSIDIANYSFIMYDPVQYTLLVIKRDPLAPAVGVSALILVIGLFLSFYCRPYELWCDGHSLYAKSEKTPLLLKQQLQARRNINDNKHSS